MPNNISLNINRKAVLTGHNAAVFALSGIVGSDVFYSGGGEGWVVSWDINNPETGRLVAKVEDRVFSLLCLEEEKMLIAGTMEGKVHWIDLTGEGRSRHFLHHKKGVFSIYDHKDWIFTAGGDGVFTKWSKKDTSPLESIQLSSTSLRSIDFSSERNEFAIGSSDNSIYILDGPSLKLKEMLREAHGNSVFSVRYTPGGQRLLSGGRDAHLKAWDLENGFRNIFSEPAHWYTINSIAVHPEGNIFATASRDKNIRIWDLESLTTLKVLEASRDGGHINSVNNLLWAGPRLLISCSDDRSLMIWEVSQE